jgi:hypothetical protein
MTQKTTLLLTTFCAVSLVLPGAAAYAKPAEATAAITAVKATPSVPTSTTALLKEMLIDYRRYAETLWHSAPTDTMPGMGYWGTGKSDGGNEGVRAIANTALVYALLSREGDKTFSVADRVEPALRYAAAIHNTGAQAGTDKRKWGDSWQSAMWAGNMGVAAYLVRDQLKPETMAAVERVVAAEADRFTTIPPPTMAPGDTKAEENAWDLTVASAALLLMPGHAHAANWQQTVLRYGFNTLPVAADKTNTTIADGKPIRDWVTTVQINADYTLENHGTFHPVYAMVAPVTLAQAAVTYKMAGKPIPDALKFNTIKGWEMLQYITQSDGEWLYPQGLDWDLHDYEHIHYWTMLGTLYRDPVAGLLENRTAQYARRRQMLNGNGSFVGPSGSLGFAREAVQAERVAFAYMMHQQFGAPPEATDTTWKKMVQSLEPVRSFGPSGFAVHRTERGLLSFSWKHHLMGLAAPLSEQYPGSPYVTTPYLQSLVGSFTLAGQTPQEASRFTVNNQEIRTDKSGFVLALDASVNAGQLRQQIAVATAAPGILVYLDRVTANSDVTVNEERSLIVGVENDEVSGGKRQVISSGGDFVAIAGTAQDKMLAGNWANIDGRLGLVTAPGSQVLYRSVEKPNRAGAREDFLYGQFQRGTPRAFKQEAVVAERAGLLLPGSSAKETERVATSLKVERTANARLLRFKGPDGKEQTLTLSDDGTVTWKGQSIHPTSSTTPKTVSAKTIGDKK